MFLSRTTRGDDRLKPFRILRCDLNMKYRCACRRLACKLAGGIPKLELSVSINPLALSTGFSFSSGLGFVEAQGALRAWASAAARILRSARTSPTLAARAG